MPKLWGWGPQAITSEVYYTVFCRTEGEVYHTVLARGPFGKFTKLRKLKFITQSLMSSCSGAEIQLLNSTGSGDEGEEISVCAQLSSIQGGLTRPLSVTIMIISGTALSKLHCKVACC